MGRTKYNDRHVRYRARQKIVESERNRELHRLRQFYNFMVDHDFVKVAIYEMERHQEENPQEWREAIRQADEIFWRVMFGELKKKEKIIKRENNKPGSFQNHQILQKNLNELLICLLNTLSQACGTAINKTYCFQTQTNILSHSNITKNIGLPTH